MPEAEFSYSPLSQCPVGSDFTFKCPSTIAPDKHLVCIHSSWVCDEDPDCPEGEDEDTSEGGPCHDLVQGRLDFGGLMPLLYIIMSPV